MRKFLTILFLIISLFGFTQNPSGPTSPLPNWNYVGSRTTLSEVRGVLNPRYGIILSRYADTTTANADPYIKHYAGMQIVIGDTVWFRNATATRWLKASGSSGSIGGNTLYSADDDLVSNRIVGLNGKTLNINQGANVFLYIDPAVNGEVIELNARNITGGGNFAGITGQTTGSNSQFDLKASFDAGASVALITASAGGGLSELNIQADSISINGVIQFNHFAGFGSGIVAVDNNGLLSWSAGSAGNTIYTGDGTLLTDRVISTDGEILQVNYVHAGGSEPLLFIAPLAGTTEIRGYHSGSDNEAAISANASATESSFVLGTIYNSGFGPIVNGVANAGGNTITYTANTHTFVGDIEYNGDAKLLANRNTDLNGKILRIRESGNDFLSIDPSVNNETVIFQAYNITGADNTATLFNSTTNLDARIQFSASFNNEAKLAEIIALSNTTSATLEYTADTHTFTGAMNVVNGANSFLSINPTAGAEAVAFRAYNTTGGGNVAGISGNTTNTTSNAALVAGFNSLAKFAFISAEADVSTATINYSADTHNFTGNILPATDDGVQLGSTTKNFSDLFLATGAVINYANSNVVLTHSSGILTMGTGEMRITTVGTNAASVVTVAGSQALTNKSINKVTITAPTTSATLTLVDGSSLITVGAFAATLTSTATTNATLPAGTNTLYSTLSGSITSAQLATSLSNETGTGVSVFGTSPTFTTSILLAGATSGNITLASDALSNALNGTTLSGLGVIDSRMFARPTSDFTLANSNADQTAFGASHDVWTLQASTSYWVEGFYFLTHGAVSHAVSIGFTLGGSASITSMNLDVATYIAAVNVVATAQSSMYLTQTASTAVNLAGANGTEMISFRGWINVNVGGTFTPILKFSADPTGTCLMKAGSYITFTPRGTNTVESAGNVN